MTYLLMTHTTSGNLADTIDATTRAGAIAAGIADMLTWSDDERAEAAGVFVVECDSAADYYRHGCEWSADITGGGILWSSLENVGRLVQRIHHYAGAFWAVRYNDEWSHDYGTVADDDDSFLMAVELAMGEKYHEIAYVGSDGYTYDVVDLAPWLE